ncbi:MAG: 50S ribosomal protein L11 methyltransferase [Thermodesulfobacteriota bacterium]
MVKPGCSDLFIYYIEGRLDPSWEKGLPATLLGNWPEEDTSFLFFKQPEDQAVHGLVAAHPELRLADVFTMSYEEWQGGRLAPFSEAGLFFTPPWFEGETPAGLERVLLDPGVVFGNGLHPTTRDCLAALGSLLSPGQSVLDLGCGTGVLSVAAHALGAGRVLAADLNPLAVQTTRGNVLLNHASDVVTVLHRGAEELTGEPADLVLANIHFAVMKNLADDPAFARHSRLVLSGLLRSEAPEIRSRMQARGAEVLQIMTPDNTWFTLLLAGAP